MRARTSDALRREIEDDIEHGRLSPGDKLDEQTLAERFEVSRTPAREALLQLAAAGIVRLVPRQGAVVCSVSPQLAIGMVEVLTALEADVVKDTGNISFTKLSMKMDGMTVAGEMRHQSEKERQVTLRDPLLIQRQDEIPCARVQQEVGIFNALGDALVGQQIADVVLA